MGTGSQKSTGSRKAELQLESPATKWLVLLINDDVTPFDWVEALLIRVFGHSSEKAKEITLNVHLKGVGLAGQYDTQEEAQMRAQMTVQLSRSAGFPLQCRVAEGVPQER